MTQNLTRLSATELARSLNDRSLKAETLTRACLEQIDAHEDQLHAWTHVARDAALARARALDSGPVQGLLHGLPMGVKDIFDTWDMPTAYGSPIYANHQPGTDAAPVALAREAGAVLLGKTVTTEFATFQAGPTRNPHNVDHTPGGSSSGSCAAVAAHMVPLAFGSQTAASIIRPAAYCGVVGYKPSYGLIARAGVKGLSDFLDTIGCVARSVEDVALLTACWSGDKSLLDLSINSSTPRIGLCRFHWDGVQPEVRDAMELAAQKLSAAGAKLIDVTLPAGSNELTQAHMDIMAYEAARALADERLRHLDQLSTPLRGVIDKGVAMDWEHYAAQIRKVEQARAAMAQVWRDVDVLLAPSAAGQAPLFTSGTGDPTWCRIWTVLGLPCIHLPFAQSPQGLPVGLQAVGPSASDRQTLAAASWMLKTLRP